MANLSVGDPAPQFSIPSSGEGNVSLSDYTGKWLVLYFYPKDDTPGCTTEAIDFTSSVAEFSALNAEVLGISKDSAAKHDKFIAKHDLGIRLGADDDGNVVESYGVWVEKKMYGRTYMGIERATFLIGPNGNIHQIWRKVRVKGHVSAVLEELKTVK